MQPHLYFICKKITTSSREFLTIGLNLHRFKKINLHILQGNLRLTQRSSSTGLGLSVTVAFWLIRHTFDPIPWMRKRMIMYGPGLFVNLNTLVSPSIAKRPTSEPMKLLHFFHQSQYVIVSHLKRAHLFSTTFISNLTGKFVVYFRVTVNSRVAPLRYAVFVAKPENDQVRSCIGQFLLCIGGVLCATDANVDVSSTAN